MTIIPEIELPGHALAALTAYPEYSCTGEILSDFVMFGVLKLTYIVLVKKVLSNS